MLPAMTRHARKAIIQVIMVVTMAVSGIVTIPIAARYSNAQSQQAIEAKGRPTAVAVSAMVPVLVALIGSIVVGMVAGAVAMRLLPSKKPGRSR